ncbi:YqzH family protein [Mesobacillus foraminis]|uniref:YqzH family protein n=1 Tax=Mesobacillus foraminis TaxID=279826 RepID=UPI0039A3D4BB
MDKKLIKKMVKNCFLQYSPGVEEAVTLSEEEFEMMYSKISQMKMREPNVDLYEIVHDVVYDFLIN